MNEKLSNLVSLSKNKFNIITLETIDHKDLFQNLNKSLVNNKFNNQDNKYENNKIIGTYTFINNNNSTNKEYEDNNNNIENIYLENDDINYNNTNSAKKIINKAKISSKSFKNIVKAKLNNFQEIFNRLSPEKNSKCLTQENDSQKKGNNKFFKKKEKNENDINIKEFFFKRNNNNINLNQNYYFSNDYKKENANISYFKLNKKKESKNSFASQKTNNNNLDVYNRLYNKSYYKKKKNNQNIAEENNCTFNPQLLSILKKNKNNNNECRDNFIKRQEQFNKYINKKKIDLKKDINKKESKKYTFTPNTSCTSGSKYSIKLEAQRQEESNLDKANRMVYDSVNKIKEKNNHLSLMYNTQYSFIPTINKSNSFTYKKITNNKNNYGNSQKREKKVKKENNIKIEPKYLKFQKFVNHEYDDIKSNYRNDKELMNRIKEENKKRTKKLDNIRKEHESEDYEGCTFKPDINKKNNSYYTNILNNNNEFNFYYNKVPIREMSYVDYYNKKKSFKNRLPRSQSYNNQNYRQINYNYEQDNINNHSNYFPNQTYSHFHNFRPNNNYNINYNEYNDCCNSNSDKNNLFIYENCNNCNNDQQFDDYYDNDKGRNFNNNSNYNNTEGYLNMSHNSNDIYKNHQYRPISSMKKEDKENFLIINKLLYN